MMPNPLYAMRRLIQCIYQNAKVWLYTDQTVANFVGSGVVTMKTMLKQEKQRAGVIAKSRFATGVISTV